MDTSKALHFFTISNSGTNQCDFATMIIIMVSPTWSVTRCFDMTGRSKLSKGDKDKCLQARWCHLSQDADKCRTQI